MYLFQIKIVVIFACTATATNRVIDDVRNILSLKRDCAIFKSSFNRKNLKYIVIPKPKTTNDTIKLVGNMIKNRFEGLTGIVYVLSRKNSEDVAMALKNEKVSACSYHAGLNANKREQIQREWQEDKIQCVVATIAFGLGINKTDVSFVIHFTFSKSIQNYYQESGRAGRDGESAECIVLYKPSDISHMASLVYGAHLKLNNNPVVPMIKYQI